MIRFFAMVLLALCAVVSSAAAGTPQLIADINQQPVPRSSMPRTLGTFNGRMLFGAMDANGGGLWSTNGTAAGTSLVRRMEGPGPFSSPERMNLVNLGSRALFLVGVATGGSEIWSTDGTNAGTQRVIDLTPGPEGTNIFFKTKVGNKLVFTTYESSGVWQTWITDGTEAGTVKLTRFTGSSGGATGAFYGVTGKFYFVAANDGYLGQKIYVSDGTEAGTRVITNSQDGRATQNPQSFVQLGSRLMYLSDGLVWYIDITTDTLYPVTDGSIYASPGFGPPSNIISELVGMNGFAVFLTRAMGPSLTTHRELWRTDGTSSGTFKVANITQDGSSDNGTQLVVLTRAGDRAAFIGEDAQYGPQLWSSDGTTAGTLRLTATAVPPPYPFVKASPVANIAGTLYFEMFDDAATRALWLTDGTVAGTRRAGGVPLSQYFLAAGDSNAVFVRTSTLLSSTITLVKYEPAADRTTELATGLRLSNGATFTYDAPRLYFAPDDPVLGNELWISDGTASGTRLLVELFPQNSNASASPDQFVDFDGRMVFAATEPNSGRELWSTDGTAANTRLANDINPGTLSSNPNHLVVLDGVLYFFARNDARSVSHLMRLRSLSSSPEVLADIYERTATESQACPRDTAVILDGIVYFVAGDPLHGIELWRSDGTTAGTRMLADVYSGSISSQPCNLTVLGKRVYFRASAAGAGSELWATDGSESGTVRVADIATGSASSFPNNLTAFSGSLYFSADDGVYGRELWRSDGSDAGTRIVTDLVPPGFSSFATPAAVLNGRLLFSVYKLAADQTTNFELQLWSTDGTAAGTSRVSNFTLDPNIAIVAIGNKAYFAALLPDGSEPAVTDGTSAGTLMFKDIVPGGGSHPSDFDDFRGITLFTAIDPTRGTQLWRTDGTSAGTVLVGDVPASPTFLTAAPVRHRRAVGQRYLFAAIDTVAGIELYGLTNDAPLVNADTANAIDSQPVTIDVLQNDSDVDGTLDRGSLRIVSNPAHGAAVITSAQRILYSPAAGFSGVDTFTYGVADTQGLMSGNATVMINVSVPTVVITPSPQPAPNTPNTPSDGGGGGSLEWWSLLWLAGALYLRRTAIPPAAAEPNTAATSHRYMPRPVPRRSRWSCAVARAPDRPACQRARSPDPAARHPR